MDYSAKYLIFLVVCLVSSEYKADDKYQKNLSRKRRYVVFPEGSTFSVSIVQHRFIIAQIISVKFPLKLKTILLFIAPEITMLT